MATATASADTSKFTLDKWIEMAATNGIDDDRIYEYLSPPLPPNSISRWLSRIQRIENALKPSDCTPAEWSGKKNRLKGRAFEAMMGRVLKSVRSFSTWKNIATTTNEIDLLVEIGLGVQVSPVIRQWGSHFICECKLVNQGVNATWIGKLNSVLELHHSEVGLLVSSKGPPRGKAKIQIYVYAFKTPPRVMICISLDDLKECENGRNFLRLISTRYIETKTGAAGLISQ